MGSKLRIGVLISGTGSNLQALIDACLDAHYPVEIAVVISNKSDAQGLSRAQKANIPTAIIGHKEYQTREAFDAAIDEVLVKYHVQFVCLAGFMRLLSSWFVEKWHNKLINTHPSLLPAFKGENAQKQALDYGVKVTGCTLHFVRPEMDVGPIIMQIPVVVKEDDTLESLRTRILIEEHKCYVKALELIAMQKVSVEHEKVIIHSLEQT